LVGDSSNVSDWNAFFQLPGYGTPFTSVIVVGNDVNLYGGSGITVVLGLFDNNPPSLVSIVDNANCIVVAGINSFGNNNNYGSILTTVDLSSLTSINDFTFVNCVSLTNLNLPSLTTAGGGCFLGCELLTTFDFPLLTSIQTLSFLGCISATTFNLSSCTDLGGSVNNDDIFLDITGNTITLTVPSALMTCNGGNPDGDIQYLQANNTVTIITISPTPTPTPTNTPTNTPTPTPT
jgi:hypothetical protein